MVADIPSHSRAQEDRAGEPSGRTPPLRPEEIKKLPEVSASEIFFSNYIF